MVKLYDRTIALLERVARWNSAEGLKAETIDEVIADAKDILKGIEEAS